MSPLPAARIAWPPRLDGYTADVNGWAAWWSGVPADLRAAAQAGSFWSTVTEERRTGGVPRTIHVPLAADVSQASADLLFGQPVEFRPYDDSPEAATASDHATRTRDLLALDATLLEAAEIAAATGGVYLRTGWDVDVADVPLVDAIPSDRAVPQFRHGRLSAVTLWRDVDVEDGTHVWRHLEHHTPGLVEHGLYRGDRAGLGTRFPLSGHPSTDGLPDTVTTPDGRLLVAYVPNVRPNRTVRHLPVGRADVAGSEPLLDALDEAWSSWMRDLRLGKARLLVAREFLEARGGRGDGVQFDVDREVFVPLELDPATREGGHAIQPVQFSLRVEEHARTVTDLIERIVSAAGYAPQTFGLQIDGRAESGTALRVRERRTYGTRARKVGYWRAGLDTTLRNVAAVWRDTFSTPVPDVPIDVVWPDPTDDPHQTAVTVELLARAQAASTETLVRMVQPDLDEQQVVEEVGRIRADLGMAVPDPAIDLG